MRFLLNFCLLFCCLSGLSQADIRVMTINAEWLWTPFDNRVDGSLSHIRDMPEKEYLEEIAFYAKLVRDQEIDILALSEIENEQVAQEVSQAIGKDWRAYFKQGLDTATGQDVAILSRLDYVEGSLTHFNFPLGKMHARDRGKKITKLVGAQFWVDQRKIGVITSHLLSKRNENRHKAENRQRQAHALAYAIEQFSKDTDHLIVMGDFNDTLDSPTLTILMQTPLSNYQTCSNFKLAEQDSVVKRWRRHIDHILFRGVLCHSQDKIDLQKYSDHDAIWGVFSFSP